MFSYLSTEYFAFNDRKKKSYDFILLTLAFWIYNWYSFNWCHQDFAIFSNRMFLLVLVDVVCSSLCNCLRCVYTVYTLYVKALIFLSCIWMASQSHCPVAGVRSVHGCNATPFLQAFGADPVQAPAQGTIDFPAQAGRPAPDKKKADGNAVSLSAPSLSCSDSSCISVRMITCEAIHFFICIYCKDVFSEF